MAKIEQEFHAAWKSAGTYQATPFLPRKPIPDIGHERIDGERFHSPDLAMRSGSS